MEAKKFSVALGVKVVRFPRAVWFGLVLILTGSAGRAAVAQGNFDYANFRDHYHCQIVQRLALLKANRAKDGRFLILAMVHHPQRFVQCLFEDDGLEVLCEASSGFYSAKAGNPRSFNPTPETVAALDQLGFSSDGSSGNFRRIMGTTSAAQLAAVADLLLSAIYDAYGARSTSKLEILAPLANLRASDLQQCTPSN